MKCIIVVLSVQTASKLTNELVTPVRNVYITTGLISVAFDSIQLPHSQLPQFSIVQFLRTLLYCYSVCILIINNISRLLYNLLPLPPLPVLNLYILL